MLQTLSTIRYWPRQQVSMMTRLFTFGLQRWKPPKIVRPSRLSDMRNITVPARRSRWRLSGAFSASSSKYAFTQLKVRKIRQTGMMITIRMLSYFILSDTVVDRLMSDTDRKAALPKMMASLRRSSTCSPLISHRSSMARLYSTWPIRKNPAPRLKQSALPWYYRTRSPAEPAKIPQISLRLIGWNLDGQISRSSMRRGNTLKIRSQSTSSWPARIQAVPDRKNSK